MFIGFYKSLIVVSSRRLHTCLFSGRILSSPFAFGALQGRTSSGLGQSSLLDTIPMSLGFSSDQVRIGSYQRREEDCRGIEASRTGSGSGAHSFDCISGRSPSSHSVDCSPPPRFFAGGLYSMCFQQLSLICRCFLLHGTDIMFHVFPSIRLLPQVTRVFRSLSLSLCSCIKKLQWIISYCVSDSMESGSSRCRPLFMDRWQTFIRYSGWS